VSSARALAQRLRVQLVHAALISATLGSIGVVSAVLPAGTAEAAKSPTLADTQNKVRDLGRQLDAASEQVNTANTALAASRARQAKLAAKIAVLRPQVAALTAETSSYAVSAYQGGDMSMMSSLMQSGSPQTFLDQVTTVESLSDRSRRQLSSLLTARASLSAEQSAINDEVTGQAAQQKLLAARKAAIVKQLATWTALRSKLSPRWTPTVGSTSYPTRPAYSGPVSGRAAVIIAFARAQLGKPYVMGAAGPGAYDCSGLTMAAYAQVGVSLPHSAHAQMGYGRIARSELRPGDLVFFFGGSHVGIYIGGGAVIHAPQPGDVVKVTSIGYMSYAGAARP
jgi:cell wall-associated NlpC family hydrolase